MPELVGFSEAKGSTRIEVRMFFRNASIGLCLGWRSGNGGARGEEGPQTVTRDGNATSLALHQCEVVAGYRNGMKRGSEIGYLQSSGGAAVGLFLSSRRGRSRTGVAAGGCRVCRMSAGLGMDIAPGGGLLLPDLKGKRVLVTGAGGGLGKSIAEEFGRQGCRVGVHYFTRGTGAEKTVDRCMELGAEQAVRFGADLRSEKALDQLVAEVEDLWGGLDVLINNAGVIPKAAAEDCNSSLFDNTYAVNVRAPYLLMRHAARIMHRDQGGVIINNSSIHGSHGAMEYMSAYAMSKGALNSMTQSLAAEWGPDIRVLAIAPGVVPVERNSAQLSKPEVKDLWHPHFPMARYGDPCEIARATAFLASSSSAWTTGTIVTVDGGMTARMNMPLRPKPPAPNSPPAIQHPSLP